MSSAPSQAVAVIVADGIETSKGAVVMLLDMVGGIKRMDGWNGDGDEPCRPGSPSSAAGGPVAPQCRLCASFMMSVRAKEPTH